MPSVPGSPGSPVVPTPQCRIIDSTNPAVARSGAQALDLVHVGPREALLARWGRLHAVRSALSLVAFSSFLILLAKG